MGPPPAQAGAIRRPPWRGPNRFLVEIELLYDDEAAPVGVAPEAQTRSRLDPVLNFRGGFESRISRRCKWLRVISRPQADVVRPISVHE